MKTLFTTLFAVAVLIAATPVMAFHTVGDHCVKDDNYLYWTIAGDGRPIIVYKCEIQGRTVEFAIAPQVVTQGVSDLSAESFIKDLPYYKGGKTDTSLYTVEQLRVLVPEGGEQDGPSVKYLVNIGTCFYWGTNPDRKGELEHLEQGSPFDIAPSKEERF